MTDKRIQNFTEFWPFYLTEHANVYCRMCHFVGTGLALGILAWSWTTAHYAWGFLALLAGYGFAWVGHFVIEKNRPATFTYPLWSLIGDFKLFVMMLTGKGWSSRPVLEQMGIESPSEA